MIFSPLTFRRLKAFRRIHRAWWSFVLLGAISAFCLAADWVCPYDPKAVIDPATLEPYRKPVSVKNYEIRTVRFTIAAGEIIDYEGPEVSLPKMNTDSEILRGLKELENDFVVTCRQRGDSRRIFLEPKNPPKIKESMLAPPPVSFPFRPCPGHPFGIDAGGRDVYSRVVHGLRIALLFGMLLAGSGMLFGLVVGAVEGYFGGRTDILLQRLTEVWSAVPFLYVMIFIGSTVGRSFAVLLVCYAVFNWIAVSYYMRAEFLRLRTRSFVEAARCQGYSAFRIIFRHIVPNALTPLLTLFPFLLMGAIGSLAALDFLGFGLPPMTPSCGELLQEAQQFRGAWWLILFPSAALFVVMLLTVLVGEGLREAFDPRHRSYLE